MFCTYTSCFPSHIASIVEARRYFGKCILFLHWQHCSFVEQRICFDCFFDPVLHAPSLFKRVWSIIVQPLSLYRFDALLMNTKDWYFIQLRPLQSSSSALGARRASADCRSWIFRSVLTQPYLSDLIVCFPFHDPWCSPILLCLLQRQSWIATEGQFRHHKKGRTALQVIHERNEWKKWQRCGIRAES